MVMNHHRCVSHQKGGGGYNLYLSNQSDLTISLCVCLGVLIILPVSLIFMLHIFIQQIKMCRITMKYEIRYKANR